jgi:hypothetical protein
MAPVAEPSKRCPHRIQRGFHAHVIAFFVVFFELLSFATHDIYFSSNYRTYFVFWPSFSKAMQKNSKKDMPQEPRQTSPQS